MDEPLSNLDAKLRVEMRGEIRELQQKMKITTLYVTHDQEEALSISDKIAVMNHGVVEQVGEPWELYNAPANRFVAGFIGTTNFFEGTWVSAQEGLGVARVADVEMRLPAKAPRPGDKVTFAIRPEALKTTETLAAEDCPQFTRLPARVTKVEYLGFVTKYDLELCPGLSVKLVSYDVLPQDLRKTGETLDICYDPRRVLVY
jgi:ABC-type Fe3+/spermidine/putrescine transport system ATPase subunit